MMKACAWVPLAENQRMVGAGEGDIMRSFTIRFAYAFAYRAA